MKLRELFSQAGGLALAGPVVSSAPLPTVEEAVGGGALLLEQAGIASARLDAECLLAHALGVPRWRLAAAPERRLAAREFARYLTLLGRRERREPLAYLVGAREFWSLPLAVSRDVLVPRPETETLVEAALAICRGTDPMVMGPRAERREPRAASVEPPTPNPQPPTPDLMLVDLCTGCGAIAIALARELASATVLASDISWRALRVARGNAAAQGVAERVTFVRGHVWQPVAGALRGRQADIVTANPPYVPSGLIPSLMPEVRWEPRHALDGGRDGLAIIRDIVAGAPRHLRPGGILLLEIGADQGRQVLALLEASQAFDAWRVEADLAGRDRVVVARRDGTGPATTGNGSPGQCVIGNWAVGKCR
jgi:release factor glutamine methyltransferase